MNDKYAAAFREIEAQVGSDSFSQEPGDLSNYGTDWSKIAGNPGAVVFPKTSELVAEILKICNQLEVPVVPSGGRTGIVGGATATSSELVISLERMNRISPVDLVCSTVRAQAGATTQQVHEHCEAQGLLWPLDLPSRGTSQIGGNIATNAGGIHVIRYGAIRNWVRGLEVATMEGKLLKMERNLVKNSTNWDLIQLFIGSEGTLGIVTSALLPLVPLPGNVETVFLAVEDLESVVKILDISRKAPFELHSFEYLDRASLSCSLEHYEAKDPVVLDTDYYVLLEFDTGNAGKDALTNWFEQQEFEGVHDGVVAMGETQRNALWLLRDGLLPAFNARGPGKTHDVSVSIAQTADFVRSLRKRIDSEHPDWDFYLLGHVGDGNVHPHLILPKGIDASAAKEIVDVFDSLVFSVVRDYGGSISAEHGVGLVKRKHLGVSRSEDELAIFRGVKKLLDPKGLLNPGKLL